VTQDKIRQLDLLVTWGQRIVGQAGRPPQDTSWLSQTGMLKR